METDSNKAEGQDADHKPCCADEVVTDPVIGHDLEGQIAAEKPRSRLRILTYIACAIAIPMLAYAGYRMYQFDQYVKAKPQPTHMQFP
jgi:uncharacterized membrane protein YebE (DUF533 family)